MNELKPEGYISFNGGMNSSIGPSLLGKDQYVYSINCIIPKTSDGIQTRFGFRYVQLEFQNSFYKKTWETGNPQGCGFYKKLNGEYVLLYSVNGYIFELTGNNYIKKTRVLNHEDQNDPSVKHCWITRVPGGAIVNNGIDAALYVTENENIRAKASKREIGPGLMGAYIQNRFWYVTPDRKEVRASTIKQPISFDEAIVDNIYGVITPEEDSIITGIGKLGTIARDAAGGNLGFATEKDFYSADVRGPRPSWGAAAQKGTGFVDNILPGIGAVAGNSFETANGNIYFRNTIYGLVSLNQGRADFQNKDSYTNHSIEGSLFFDNDSKHMLDSCYTKAYNKSIYTTVAPQYNCERYVYWNGLIVKTPDPYYGKEKDQQQDVVESVFTGLRPWNVNVSGDVEQNMFIMSYDYDCINRLYLYDESSFCDVNQKNQQVAIEAQIRTRSFDFSQPLFPKKPEHKFYSLANIKKDTTITVSARITDTGEFKKESELTFKSGQTNALQCDSCPESIDNVSLPEIKTNKFFTIQDNIIIRGWCVFKRYIRLAEIIPFDKIVYKEQAKKEQLKCDDTKIYTHKISK